MDRHERDRNYTRHTGHRRPRSPRQSFGTAGSVGRAFRLEEVIGDEFAGAIESAVPRASGATCVLATPPACSLRYSVSVVSQGLDDGPGEYRDGQELQDFGTDQAKALLTAASWASGKTPMPAHGVPDACAVVVFDSRGGETMAFSITG